MSEPISTKPYFIRALYEWCTDNGYTPYIVVKVQGSVRVPMEFVRNGEIVLNISFEATGQLKMDNQGISFKARFGEVSRDIYVPIEAVAAIYASENNQGMAFEVTAEKMASQAAAEVPISEKPAVSLAVTNTDKNKEKNPEKSSPSDDPPSKVKRKKPGLTIIK